MIFLPYNSEATIHPKLQGEQESSPKDKSRNDLNYTI